ncbi:hypothetical protein [Thioalkalivibrio thiocyanodenitrificans]|uniref:hypothetical protein n=1 Tax=Thioalkalivibrio thiocyanodenitrificans TaxID=243063 RepID=UPI0003704881|nr:hypothetical protein [Thioalkalivibrio thiocyanodenitrificans]
MSNMIDAVESRRRTAILKKMAAEDPHTFLGFLRKVDGDTREALGYLKRIAEVAIKDSARRQAAGLFEG